METTDGTRPDQSHRKPRQAKDYRLEVLDGEVLLYHRALTKTLYLNETASLVWRLCDGERTTQEITSILCAAFPDATTVEADVRSTIESLLELRAITYG